MFTRCSTTLFTRYSSTTLFTRYSSTTLFTRCSTTFFTSAVPAYNVYYLPTLSGSCIDTVAVAVAVPVAVAAAAAAAGAGPLYCLFWAGVGT